MVNHNVTFPLVCPVNIEMVCPVNIKILIKYNLINIITLVNILLQQSKSCWNKTPQTYTASKFGSKDTMAEMIKLKHYVPDLMNFSAKTTK